MIFTFDLETCFKVTARLFPTSTLQIVRWAKGERIHGLEKDFAYRYGPDKDFARRSAMTLTFVQGHCTLSTKWHSMGEV